MINVGVDGLNVYVEGDQVAVYVENELVWSIEPPFEYPVTRIYHDFTGDTVDANIDDDPLSGGNGFTFRTAPTRAASVGQAAFNPLTGQVNLTNLDRDSDSGANYSHVTLNETPPEKLSYMRLPFQIDQTADTEHGWRLGVIPWQDPFGSPNSGIHLVVTTTSVFVQDFDGGLTPDTLFDWDWPVPLTDSSKHVVEWVANYATEDVVVIVDHNVVGSFNSPRIGSLAQFMPDWETGYSNTEDDHRAWHDHVAAEWVDEEINVDTLAYMNAFLVEESLDPIVLPEPVTFGFVEAPFVEGAPLSTPVAFDLTDNEIADLLVAICGNATGATIPAAPATGPTYVTPTNGTISGASNALRLATKLVTVAGTESTGPWSANTDSEVLVVGKYRGFTVGVCASATGTSATVTWPALTGFTAGSYVLLFLLHESASADFSGAPATFTNRQRIVTSDYNAVLLDNILSGPVSSFAGATLNGGNSDAYKAIALELKPV